MHFDIKNKDILIIGPTQGLNDTTLTAEAKHLINFTQPRKRFVLSLHYYSYLLMLQNISIQSKALK